MMTRAAYGETMFRALIATALLGALLTTSIAAAAPRKPRLSPTELQTVRSWSRVLDVYQASLRKQGEGPIATVMEQAAKCPAVTAASGEDALKAFAALLGVGIYEGIARGGPDLRLAATRIQGQDVRSAPLVRWKRIQVQSFQRTADLSALMTEPRDPCAMMAAFLSEDPSPDAALTAFGVAEANRARARTIMADLDRLDAAQEPAAAAVDKFLLQRGVTRLDVTRDTIDDVSTSSTSAK